MAIASQYVRAAVAPLGIVQPIPPLGKKIGQVASTKDPDILLTKEIEASAPSLIDPDVLLTKSIGASYNIV